MSRIGNNPITVPEGVNVEIQADSVKVSGKLGTLNQNIDGVSVLKEENGFIILIYSNLIFSFIFFLEKEKEIFINLFFS